MTNLLNNDNDYSQREVWREAIAAARDYADGDESVYTFPELVNDDDENS